MTKKHMLRMLCAGIIAVFLLNGTMHIVKRKVSDIDYQVFYEQSEKYDVLFYGASLIHYSVFPMQLWNDYGIASYNMANDSERLPMTYYHILNSLDYASPRLVVVELTHIAWIGAMRDGSAKDHNFLDSVPLSKNKILEITEIFDEGSRLEFLFPFYTYHNRWEFLGEQDFSYDRNVYYGTAFLSGVGAQTKPTPEDYEKSRFGDMELERYYILKIAELCADRGVNVLFTHFPSAFGSGDLKLREFCRNLAEENGLNYLDMLYLDTIDWGNDFIKDGHMNYYGGSKVTDYLGNYIVSNYDIPDRRGDSDYSTWNDDYVEYVKLVEEFKAGG